jgi:hypothetical protein
LKALFLSSLFLLSFLVKSQVWTQINDFPGIARDDGTSFTIGNKSYCGTGIVPFYTLRDFYYFNIDSSSWSTINSLPQGEQRQYACGFASDSFGYVFGGVNDSEFLNDLWAYDPRNDNWEQKTSLPSTPRAGASSFVIDSVAYIIGGKTDSLAAINEVWAYHMKTDSWTRKNNFPFGSRWRASATANNSLGYLAYGLDSSLVYHDEVYQYNPRNDSWTLINKHPKGARNYVKMHLIGNQLISIAGMDSSSKFLNDCWSYNLSSSTWKELDTIPSQGVRGGMSFVSNNAIYYSSGLGEDRVRTKESWRLENATILFENKNANTFHVFPNPFHEEITIAISKLGSIATFNILDIQGKVVKSGDLTQGVKKLDLYRLDKGFYFIIIKDEGETYFKKLIKL